MFFAAEAVQAVTGSLIASACWLVLYVTVTRFNWPTWVSVCKYLLVKQMLILLRLVVTMLAAFIAGDSTCLVCWLMRDALLLCYSLLNFLVVFMNMSLLGFAVLVWWRHDCAHVDLMLSPDAGIRPWGIVVV
jgi:hypothetical protein